MMLQSLKDFDVIDLPFPLRKLHLTPLGTLIIETSDEDSEGDSARRFKLDRGVTAFPTVGDPVHLPTPTQLRSIIEATGADRRIHIGTSPMASGVAITADPDRLFGRHLAVLGNTGSGKSCTVAGLIRWSLEAAREKAGDASVNARFIVLDPNGEYQKAFADFDPKPRVFRFNPRQQSPGDNVKPLCVPAWMWNSHEWSAFAGASRATQHPLLMQALRDLRSGIARTAREKRIQDISKCLRLRLFEIRSIVNRGPDYYSHKPGKGDCGNSLESFFTEVNAFLTTEADLPTEVAEELKRVRDKLSELVTKKRKTFTKDGEVIVFWEACDFLQWDMLRQQLESFLSAVSEDVNRLTSNEDMPVSFDIDKLPDYVDALAGLAGGSTPQYVASMTTRLRTILADSRLRPIIAPSDEFSLSQWLGRHIGENSGENGELAIIDLSLVPSDVISTVMAVIARLIFEATQRYVKLNGETLPTVLVLEEAHTFIARQMQRERESDVTSAAQMCRQTFERIAREGRKFGLGLVLSSQRPSELSQTVLAQCNTFILHRIVNDKDQELVGRLVPDSLGGLLRELSSLPSRRAIMLGWAAPIPTLLDVNELPEKERPRSKDPDFWDVWTGKKPRPVEWKKVVDDWVGTPTDQAKPDCAEREETGEVEPQ